MSYDSPRSTFSGSQLKSILVAFRNLMLNQGNTTNILSKDDYTMKATTEKNPQTFGSMGDKVPISINVCGPEKKRGCQAKNQKTNG